MQVTERKMKRAIALTGSLFVGILLIAGTAMAQQPQNGNWQGGPGGNWGHGTSTNEMQMRRAPGVFGTVTAISGTTITLESRGFGQNIGTTTYSVNASGATVMKDQTTSSLSAIAVGDTLMVEGTVSGDMVTATMIHDGLPPRGQGGPRGQGDQSGAMASLQGNGEPIVGGTITAISGDSITITNKSNVTYTVDGTNAKVVKDNATSSMSGLVNGDRVLIQGTVNGTAITATSIIDQGAAPTQNANSQTIGNDQPGRPADHGFMGVIGGFFHRLFGFF